MRSVYAVAAVLVAAFGAGIVAFVVRSGPPMVITGELPRARPPELPERRGDEYPAASAANDVPFGERLAAAAFERTRHRIKYDSSYRVIAYPGGDVPADRGVCTDVIIRSYRAVGIDLQVLVHEDMLRHFRLYPKKWGLTAPDPNIDHRRVPNLRAFLGRHGKALSTTRDAGGYSSGDVVTWELPRGLSHVGIVTLRKARSGRPLVAHNIGAGPKAEDVLFKWKVTGHYRYPK